MPPEASGSGNFATPCLRMQAENATIASSFDLPVTSVLVVVDDVEVICATFAPDPEELPQPAASNAELAAATASAAIEALLPLQRLRGDMSAVLGFMWGMHSARPVTAGEPKLLPGCNLRSGYLAVPGGAPSDDRPEQGAAHFPFRELSTWIISASSTTHGSCPRAPTATAIASESRSPATRLKPP
jgi:hypothetical protein